MEKERKFNGWVYLTIATIYLPLVHLASKWMSKREKEKKNN